MIRPVGGYHPPPRTCTLTSTPTATRSNASVRSSLNVLPKRRPALTLLSRPRHPPRPGRDIHQNSKRTTASPSAPTDNFRKRSSLRMLESDWALHRCRLANCEPLRTINRPRGSSANSANCRQIGTSATKFVTGPKKNSMMTTKVCSGQKSQFRAIPDHVTAPTTQGEPVRLFNGVSTEARAAGNAA